MVINKHMDAGIDAMAIKDFMSARTVKTWVLNGPAVDATNEQNAHEVDVTYRVFDGWDVGTILKPDVQLTFEPHSLTPVEISREQ